MQHIRNSSARLLRSGALGPASAKANPLSAQGHAANLHARYPQVCTLPTIRSKHDNTLESVKADAIDKMYDAKDKAQDLKNATMKKASDVQKELTNAAESTIASEETLKMRPAHSTELHDTTQRTIPNDNGAAGNNAGGTNDQGGLNMRSAGSTELHDTTHDDISAKKGAADYNTRASNVSTDGANNAGKLREVKLGVLNDLGDVKDKAKDKYEDLKGRAAEETAYLKDKLGNNAEVLKDKAYKMKAKAEEGAAILKEKVLDNTEALKENAYEVKDKASDNAEALKHEAYDMKAKAEKKAQNVKDKARDNAEVLKDKAGAGAETVRDGAYDMKNKAQKGAENLKENIQDNVDGLEEKASDKAYDMKAKVGEGTKDVKEKVREYKVLADAYDMKTNAMESAEHLKNKTREEAEELKDDAYNVQDNAKELKDNVTHMEANLEGDVADTVHDVRSKAANALNNSSLGNTGLDTGDKSAELHSITQNANYTSVTPEDYRNTTNNNMQSAKGVYTNESTTLGGSGSSAGDGPISEETRFNGRSDVNDIILDDDNHRKVDAASLNSAINEAVHDLIDDDVDVSNQMDARLAGKKNVENIVDRDT
ncbi:hypothetical protein SARC_06096 [Sphaeroforma arctica JP610]|uniref:Uncharacterized protein n=1 Tax=Sphaeroforma arctica JP610 TaxID=667725 RepID=A0A0L0FXP5_9EUKA|nr:hypothetical protein SARC_06096 [Sphaeroforma arctica JP610]KNC81595.1 hypothetical protein SARC_06096 [Sphaeroforma arctica JP610]|eukprot:XP_014155497.1 hypothetical protein SARC_06096 [Sphaeroforma arctica JP610]